MDTSADSNAPCCLPQSIDVPLLPSSVQSKIGLSSAETRARPSSPKTGVSSSLHDVEDLEGAGSIVWSGS